MPITVTEALAELKTINKRINKKREFVGGFLMRQDLIRDPLAKDGGSDKVIESERQSIGDLEQRVVSLRRGIRTANENTQVTIGGVTRSIADWLVWRREVAPDHQNFLRSIRQKIDAARETARRQGHSVVSPGGQPEKLTDIIVNLDERELGKEAEYVEQVLGELDGVLSLKNATIMIEV